MNNIWILRPSVFYALRTQKIKMTTDIQNHVAEYVACRLREEQPRKTVLN